MKHKRLARAHRILIAAKIHQPPGDELLQHLFGLGMGGRKGKGVSLIKGLDLASDELKKLGSELKKKCGCGGAVKDGVIEVQTDDREKLRTLLTDKGYKVKLAGG